MPKANLENKGNFTMSVGDGKEFNAANIAKNLPEKIGKANTRRLEIFSSFVKNSLENASFNKSFDFGKISAQNAKRLKEVKDYQGKKVDLSYLDGYTLKISANAIRHIKNNHPQDLDLLNNLFDIYHNFDDVKWNLSRNSETGKMEFAVSFFKAYKDGVAKAVELRDLGNKTLDLKTLFRVDEK